MSDDAPIAPAADNARSSRRAVLKGVGLGAGAIWVAPTIDSFLTPAAATSGTATASFFKSGSGSTNPLLSALCQTGALSTAQRGTAVFVRTENPTPQICVTLTMSTGSTATGREIYILQSTSAGACVSPSDTVLVGTWAASPAGGPQTFCAAILATATKFVAAQQLSGGGGNDGWSSAPPVSLP